jgi:hypothetical protein
MTDRRFGVNNDQGRLIENDLSSRDASLWRSTPFALKNL